jgi:hypothetical protein
MHFLALFAAYVGKFHQSDRRSRVTEHHVRTVYRNINRAVGNQGSLAVPDGDIEGFFHHHNEKKSGDYHHNQKQENYFFIDGHSNL